MLTEEQQAILNHESVQKFLWVLNGLLDGSKKLVIETTHHTSDGMQASVKDGYFTMKHTFRVEDATAQP